MAPAKRRRKPPAAAERTLPADVLLEIVARSEPATLVRCAAACRSLRREILHPSFLRRVTEQDGAIIPPCILAYLHSRSSIHDHSHDQKLELSVTLVHPATPVASSFADGILASNMPCCATDIHGSYEPLMSRGGLVVLRRAHNTGIGTSIRSMSDRCYDLCVFNPMTGDRTYLSCRCYWFRTYVLLTAADGIGCRFLLLAANVDLCTESGGFKIMAQATKVDGTAWGPVTSDTCSLPFRMLQHQREPIVLHRGIIHWLLSDGEQVLTYDICTQRLGTMELPPTTYGGSERLLGMSPNGRMRLLEARRFIVSMWAHLSDGWAKEAVIDMKDKVQSLHPHISIDSMRIEPKCSGERSGVVLLQAYHGYWRVRPGSLIVLDLETKEMRIQKLSHTNSLLFEVDLSERLQAMKIY